jgi:hypothetical protein
LFEELHRGIRVLAADGCPGKEFQVMAKNLSSDVLSPVPNFIQTALAVIAALLPVILPDKYIPEQLDSLRMAATGLAFTALLVAIAYRHRLFRYKGILAIAAFLSACAVLAIHLSFVVKVPELGNPPGTYYFLVGWEITEEGRAMLERVGAVEVSLPEQIRRVGYDKISVMYGRSYSMIRNLFSAAAVLLLLMTILALIARQPRQT